VVVTKQGRREVPIRVLAELYEQVAEQRRKGTRKLHALEPVMLEARRRAGEMRPDPSLEESRAAGPHRSAELRALAYHRAVAPRLRRETIDEAARKLSRWREEGKVDSRHAAAWEEVLALPMDELRQAIVADDEHGRDLRQNSPLAGLLSEPERRKLLELV
jgi:hypothetical protein